MQTPPVWKLCIAGGLVLVRFLNEMHRQVILPFLVSSGRGPLDFLFSGGLGVLRKKQKKFGISYKNQKLLT